MNLVRFRDGNISNSIKKLRWNILAADERAVLYLCQSLGINETLARILVNRGYDTPESLKDFLKPKLRDLLPDPFILKDMDLAVARIIDAMKSAEKITIFADYDVDGATSAALLKKFLVECGSDAQIYVPDRITEGYGPNVEAMRKIRANGTKLLITVDCGTTAFAALNIAKEIGLDVIVLDHHATDGILPPANAVVNPNRLDDDFPYKTIAAVAVTFLTTIALRSKLRLCDWFKNRQEPDLMKYLDLVALGTVCDVMPLTNINRAFVLHGLHIMAKRQNLGLKTLADISKLDSKPRSFHLGYILGPRINAGGRISESELGVRLLTTESQDEAHAISMKLDMLNNERKLLESNALDEIITQIEIESNDDPVVFAVGENWHVGVLGILASRIKEQYNKPAIVISIVGGIGKGSARSIFGIDLGAILHSAKASGILIDGGGHAMAGGLTIDASRVEDLKAYFLNKVQKIKHLDGLFAKALELKIDAVISINASNRNLVEAIEEAEPFGQGNPQPKFAIFDICIIRVLPFGNGHFSLILKDKHDPDFKKTLKAVFFRAAEAGFSDVILRSVGRTVDIVGTLHSDDWEREKVKFILEDIAFHE